MTVFCAFLYHLNTSGVRQKICALNAKWQGNDILDPEATNIPYPYNAPILECNINRNSVSSVEQLSFGLITNSGNIKINDNPSLFEGWGYENLADYLSKENRTCHIDIYLFSAQNAGYLIEKFIVSDFSYSYTSQVTNLVLSSELLSLQNRENRLTMLESVDDYGWAYLTTDSNVTTTLIYYENIIEDFIVGAEVKYDTMTENHLAYIVVPRPYTDKVSLWNSLQKFCEAFGCCMFESNGKIRIEYAYSLR
jgi:hypothetical protein